MKTRGGRVALNEKESVPLTVQADGTLTASFKADKDGSYHVELDAPNGERVAASPQYTIDVLTDRAPTVTFARPAATPPRRRSKRSSSRRPPTTTMASRIWSWSTR